MDQEGGRLVLCSSFRRGALQRLDTGGNSREVVLSSGWQDADRLDLLEGKMVFFTCRRSHGGETVDREFLCGRGRSCIDGNFQETDPIY